MIKEVEEINCYRELMFDAQQMETSDHTHIKEWGDSVLECRSLDLITEEMKEGLYEVLITRCR